MQKCEEILKSGENKAEKIIAEMTYVIKSGNPTKIDYISVVNYEDLQPVSYIQIKSGIAVAAFWGTTRLIDNMIVHVDDSSYEFIY